MFLSPADRGPDAARGGTPAGPRDGWLAAPLADSPAFAQAPARIAPARAVAGPGAGRALTNGPMLAGPMAGGPGGPGGPMTGGPMVGGPGVSGPGPAASGTAGGAAAGRPRGGGAAANSAAVAGGRGRRLAEAGVRAGGCFVRPLPLDSTCASVARSFFRESVAGAGLPGDLIHDGVTMASELAANTLNAHGNIEYGGHGHRAVSGIPEFWLYLRNAATGTGREIVCKIFDSEPGWDAGEPVPIGAAVPAGPDSVRGRGLQMVAGLSAGMWGHHLSRGRLGVWKVPGKAVWFALRVPATSELARSERIAPRGRDAIEELAATLADRGLGAGLVPVTEPGGDLAVLSVSHKLTVWCQNQILWWREPDGNYDRMCVTDLTEATERIIATHEELTAEREGRPVARFTAPPMPVGPPDGYHCADRADPAEPEYGDIDYASFDLDAFDDGEQDLRRP
jgi:hypothetical protein